MTPEISEFSYGFALTNEIVGWAPITAAPMFPSLIEEGKAGGGYDVKLDLPGIPLYLQFKRADCMTRRSAREIRDHNLALSLPFYRFKITESGKSDQHELLLALDDGSSVVLYAAPRFHTLTHIDDAWSSNAVASRSIFVAPSTIGPLDSESHHVAYDRHQAWLCSNPKPVEFLSSNGLLETLQRRLDADRRPMREKVPILLEQIRAAQVRAAARISERFAATAGGEESIDVIGRAVPMVRPEPTATAEPPPFIRSPRPLAESEQHLRDIADAAARLFDTQLIIVQPPV